MAITNSMIQTELKLDNTFVIDLDGTILLHKTAKQLDNLIKKYGENSYKHEKLCPNVKKWFDNLSKYDKIIIMTARPKSFRNHTKKVLKFLGIKFDGIIFDVGCGPRILINDKKPDSQTGIGFDINTAFGINVKRNIGFGDVKHCYV